MRLGGKCGKTGRVCAALLAAVFLTLIVSVASLPPDKFFAGMPPQNRVDGLIRVLKIIDGTNNRVEETVTPVLRSPAAFAWPGSGHCTDISPVSPTGEREPTYDFAVSQRRRADGVDTVARE